MTTYNIPLCLKKNPFFLTGTYSCVPLFVCVRAVHQANEAQHITYSSLWGQYTQHIFQYKVVWSRNLSSFKMDFIEFCV